MAFVFLSVAMRAAAPFRSPDICLLPEPQSNPQIWDDEFSPVGPDLVGVLRSHLLDWVPFKIWLEVVPPS